MSIAHHVVGSGPRTVLLTHGWFGSAAGWGPFVDYLDRDAARWVFTDVRGFGDRRGEQGDQSLEESARDLLAVADELGADRFTLVGHSMGGAVVQRALSLAPDRVEAIVGISPVGALPTPFDDAGRGLFWGAAESRDNRFGIIDFTTGNRNTPLFVNRIVDWSLAHSDVDAFARVLDAGPAPTSPTRCAAASCPSSSPWASTTRRSGSRPSPRPGCRSIRTRGSRWWPTPGTTRCSRHPCTSRPSSTASSPSCRRTERAVAADLRALTASLHDPSTYVDDVPYAVLADLRREHGIVRVEEPEQAGWPEGPGLLARAPARRRGAGAARPGHVLLLAGRDPDPRPRHRPRLGAPDDAEHGPAGHSRLRRMLSRSFTPRAVAALEANRAATRGAIVDRMIAGPREADATSPRTSRPTCRCSRWPTCWACRPRTAG